MRGEVSETVGRAVHIFGYLPCPEGVCTDDLLLRKHGFLISAMHTAQSLISLFSAALVIFCSLVFFSLAAKSDFADCVCFAW
jgi:hypothetical protein